MERYGAYKDSGVEWIGEIPEGWETRRLKQLSSRLTVGVVVNPSSYFDDAGTVPFLRGVNVFRGRIDFSDLKTITQESNEVLAKSMLHTGDIVIMRVGEPGVAALIPSELDGSNCASLLVQTSTPEVAPKYLCYALNSSYCMRQFSALSNGAAQKQINASDAVNVAVACPSLEVQRAIADYLDAKTAEIDALVADCEREVELLREYRKAVISEAVTKGLDPDAPMKDSGVEWIGEIPAHWGAGKLLRHARLESGHTPSRLHPEWWIEEECTIPWITTQDVHRFRNGRITSIDDTELHVSQIGLDNSSARLLPAGTVSLSRTASVGFSIVMNIPMASSQDFADWVPDETLDSYYLLYSLRSMDKVFKQLQMGSTHKTIYMPDIMKLAIAFPPIEEQRSIVAYLDAKIAEIDSLIEAKQSMAEKLREYRKSLISEAVTGKFKVPGV